MQTERHIRRLVQELVLPDQADQVIQRPKYWTAFFCQLFFDRCDELIFDHPQIGLESAQYGPELVELTARETRIDEEEASLRLRAIGVVGSAHRACDDLEAAADTYELGFNLLSKEQIGKDEKANFFFRVAVLRYCQNRIEQAFDLAEQAVSIYRETTDDIKAKHLGEALTIRGFLSKMVSDHGSAAKDFSEAVRCTDPKKYERIHHVASHNLAWALAESSIDQRALGAVAKHLREGRRFLAKRPRSRQKFRMLWLEATIMLRLGSTRRGEAHMRKARQGFIDLENGFDLALVSFDLVEFVSQHEQWEEARQLATETVELFGAVCADKQANDALELWSDAVSAKSLTKEMLTSTRETIQQRIMLAFRESRTADSSGHLHKNGLPLERLY
ncbi:MAG: hypothetical protein GY719_11565 [bacterium]|nr:hypothetical protein [bacterium]